MCNGAIAECSVSAGTPDDTFHDTAAPNGSWDWNCNNSVQKEITFWSAAGTGSNSAGRDFLVGPDYTIADVATFPWILALDHLEGVEVLEYDSFTNIEPWLERCESRPSAQRGIEALRFV